MKIDPTGLQTPKHILRKRKTQQSGASEFSGALDAQQEETAASSQEISGTIPVGPSAPVLSTQEVGSETIERNRARSRGLAILDHLDTLRQALLQGRISEQNLADITELTHAQREAVNDPRLHEILDEIELRAKVELAKHQR